MPGSGKGKRIQCRIITILKNIDIYFKKYEACQIRRSSKTKPKIFIVCPFIVSVMFARGESKRQNIKRPQNVHKAS